MSTMTGRMECRYCRSSSFHLPGCPCEIRPRTETPMTGQPGSTDPYKRVADEISDELLKRTPEERTRILFRLVQRLPLTVRKEIEEMRREGLL